MKHGKGKWRKRGNEPNCNAYEGSYELDKKCGLGTFLWESGNQYRGCYKDDERHGYGEMYWTDGSCYKGEWLNGIQHGLGRMEFPDGRLKEGIFENNIYKQPAMNTPQLKQMKAQEILMNQDLTSPVFSSQGREKSRERGTGKRSSGVESITSPERLGALQTTFDQAMPIGNKISLKRPEKLNPV